MNIREVQRINNSLLIKLCRKIGEKEVNKAKAKECSLILNDALVKLEEV